MVESKNLKNSGGRVPDRNQSCNSPNRESMASSETRAKRIRLLQGQHMSMCEANSPWQQVWTMLLESQEFLDKLDKAAKYVTKHCGLPSDCIYDVKQEALLEFAKLVRKRVDTGFQSEKGTYSNWLSTILFGCCRKAIRQFKDTYRQTGRLSETSIVDNSFLNAESRIDLSNRINKLRDPVRAVIFLYLNGRSIQEIAAGLQRSERTVYRLLEAGKREIEQELLGEQETEIGIRVPLRTCPKL